MSKKIRLCINTQTPLVRFKLDYEELLEKYGGSIDSIKIDDLKQGIDYDFSPGGVTSMVYPIVRRMVDMGIIEEPRWISLGPGAPYTFRVAGAQLYNVWLERRQLTLYSNFKEGIWNEIHGLGHLVFKPEEYQAYVSYNWLCAKLMLEMLKDVDIYWIHDFQQLHTGNLIGPSAPAILRWHIPFRLQDVSSRLRSLILKSIEGFDAIVVSTKRDLQGLIHAGYRGKAYAIYPYLDEKKWVKPTQSSVEHARLAFNLRNEDRVLLVVGRMDPVKNQDVAIKAVSRLKKLFPSLKLVLAGNGSFTGSPAGGLGHPKASRWRAYLESLVRELRMEDTIVFTGHVDHEQLSSLYSISEAVIVPSNVEGFNLTAVEGWLHEKPCIVSRGAGVSELVHDQVNGYVFTPGDDLDLSAKIEILFKSKESAIRLGENGSRMAHQCYVDNAVESLQVTFENVLKQYLGEPDTAK